MIEIIKCVIEKLNSWQILVIILTAFIIFGAVIFFILINRIYIKLCGILEINAKEHGDKL